MATSTAKRRSSSVRRRASSPLVSHERKKEVLGLMLMASTVLLSLALLSHSAEDESIVRSLSFSSLLDPSQHRAANLLGPIGAAIADLLVVRSIGYFSLLPASLLFAWGYVIFRRRRPATLRFYSALGMLAAFLLSSVFGWISLTWELEMPAVSGLWGLAISRWLVGFLGTLGAGGILLLFTAVVSMLAIRRDIQSTVDRVESWGWSLWYAVRDRVTEWVRESRRRNEEVPAPAVPRTRPAQPELRKELAYAELDDEDDAVSIVKPEPMELDRAGAVSVHVQRQVQVEKAEPPTRRAASPPASLPYRFPPLDLLEETDRGTKRVDYAEIEENNQILLDKLATYSIEITNINAIVGPTVTMYELTPAPGVKISRITALENDLAMAMAARGIRMIAPIPGKSAVGVEIPNRHRELVRVRDIIGTTRFQNSQMELPVAIGKAIDGEVFVEDLTKMPHLLIAGATGSGKSVGLNTLVVGLLYACHPSNLKFVMIDPKKIELQQYAQIFDHFAAMPPDSEDPIVTDFTEALGVLKCCEKEMELRYDLLSDAGVRGVKEYNQKFATGKLDPDEGHRHLPYVVVIVDELADLMMTAGKDIEGPIARLAQMARAVGIHLVLATQRPSVDVITGLIKANFPSRIAYQVASKVDSRTILDQNGAEGLVGNGDLLYMNGSRVVRLQGPFVSVEEVEEVMRFIGDQPAPGPYILPPIEQTGGGFRETEVLEDTDDLFDEAARIIVRSQQGSVSLLQRRLSVGYTRAARIVDQLEEAGVVGPFEGSKARQVLIESEPELDEFLAARK